MTVDTNTEHWDQVARKWSVKGYSNKLLAEHKRKTHLNLVERWSDVQNCQRILKTDLFAEAFGLEQFLLDIAQSNDNIVGIDISREIALRANKQAIWQGEYAMKYICCDVRHLPFQRNAFDLIISDSSLDHFHKEIDIVTALKELGRVLQPGGILILTIDNKSNLTYPPRILFYLWMKLGLAPYFIGKTLSLTMLRHSLEKIGFSVEESTAIFHYPHPDGLLRWLEHYLHKLSRGKLDNVIRQGFAFTDKLERKRTRYLTGRYIAVKAIKMGNPTQAH